MSGFSWAETAAIIVPYSWAPDLVSVTVGPNGTKSFHKDPPTAISTIGKVRELERQGGVFVASAHDAMLEGRMPEYPNKLNGWKGSLWKEEIDKAVEVVYGKMN